MTDTDAPVEARRQRQRAALEERMLKAADLCCETPLPGPLGDFAYDLLKQGAAQIASDRRIFARLATEASKDAEIERLKALLRQAEGSLSRLDLSEGVCCCGTDMENHDLYCGHSPVDAGTIITGKSWMKSAQPYRGASDMVEQMQAGEEDSWRYPNLWALQCDIADRLANGQKWTWFERREAGWYVGLGPISDFLPIWPIDCDDEAFVVTLIEALNGHQVAGRDSPPQITSDAIAALRAQGKNDGR